MNGTENLARLLEVEPKLLADLDSAMRGAIGSEGVFDRVWAENELETGRVLARLGLPAFVPEAREKLRDEILAYEKKLVAVADALAPFGATFTTLPLTPEAVLRAIDG